MSTKNKYSREALRKDYENHFVGMGRMTKTQFDQWYDENWKSNNKSNNLKKNRNKNKLYTKYI